MILSLNLDVLLVNLAVCLWFVDCLRVILEVGQNRLHKWFFKHRLLVHLLTEILDVLFCGDICLSAVGVHPIQE